MSCEIEPTQLLIPLWHVARALGWSTELTRDRFIRARIAIKPPGASEWSVLRSKLLAEMPVVVERIDEMVASGELLKVRKNRHTLLAHYKISTKVSVPRDTATRPRHRPAPTGKSQ